MNIVRTLRKITTSINPVLANKIMHKKLVGRTLNLKNPQTFNDKINWLKIYKYPTSDFVIKCADKYEVRNYLKEKNLDKYLVNLLYVWDNPSQIDWEKLPKKFVIKCNHGMNYNIICTDKSKLDINKAKKQLNRWMKEDFGKVSGERHYSKIKRKIICEEYLGDNLIDIQFWCSYGKVLFISYIKSPHGGNEKITFDEDWNKLDFVTSLPILEEKIKKPKKLEEMLKVVKNISKDMVFLRFDFYILENDDVKISELSFTPGSGFIKWYPREYDYKIGELINIEK